MYKYIVYIYTFFSIYHFYVWYNNKWKNDGDDLYMAKPIESILDISKFYRDIRDILPATPAKLKTIGFEYE